MPHVSLLLAWGATVGVALLFAEHADLLVNIVSLGALVAYVAVNVSVLASFARRQGARLWSHRIAPVLGVTTTLAVITQMPVNALGVGFAWFALGWAGSRLWRPRAATAA